MASYFRGTMAQGQLFSGNNGTWPLILREQWHMVSYFQGTMTHGQLFSGNKGKFNYFREQGREQWAESLKHITVPIFNHFQRRSHHLIFFYF